MRALSIIWSGWPGFAQDLEVRSEIAFTNFDFWSTLDENFLIHFQKLECESFVMSHNLINQIIGVMLRLRRALRKMNCVSCEIAIFSQSQFANSQFFAIHFTTLRSTFSLIHFEMNAFWQFDPHLMGSFERLFFITKNKTGSNWYFPLLQMYQTNFRSGSKSTLLTRNSDCEYYIQCGKVGEANGVNICQD